MTYASNCRTWAGWPVTGGYVVTNHHVVAGRKSIVLLRMDGVKIPASVAVDDATNDLVLLKPRYSELLPPALPLANRAAQVGGHAFTVDYPHPDMMGVEPKTKATCSTGPADRIGATFIPACSSDTTAAAVPGGRSSDAGTGESAR